MQTRIMLKNQNKFQKTFSLYTICLSQSLFRLMDYPVSTFLVRARLSADDPGTVLGHAVSLRTDRDVKHMKICTERHEDSTTW